MDGRAGQALSCKTGLQTLYEKTDTINVFASEGVFHLLTLHGNLNIIFDYA